MYGYDGKCYLLLFYFLLVSTIKRIKETDTSFCSSDSFSKCLYNPIMFSSRTTVYIE